MALTNRRHISLYEEAKAGLSSLINQTALVGAGFLFMLLVTGGNPPGFVVGFTVCLGIAFVAWNEKKRLTDPKQLLKFAKDFASKDFASADLRGVNLRAAFLSGANLRDAFLRNANLSVANLSGADLRSADLRGAILSGAILSGANLSSAILSSAILRGAILRGAIVENARFGFNEGLSQDMKVDLEERGGNF
ncbi:MAG: pentapeptide repeat-containing protein [Rhizonema sp. PD38]|nr:pentapeptide repeat-containing protein [Rhizonema sp. PD38]